MTYRTCIGLLVETDDRDEAEEITRQFVTRLASWKAQGHPALLGITPLVGPVIGYTTSIGPITDAEYEQAAAEFTAHQERRRR